jgi:hypothetical protein
MIYPSSPFPGGIGGGLEIAERKLAVVPRVVISGMLGERDYGVLLTDRRMIFVLERSSRVGIAAGLGGIVGATIASEMAAERREFVYADADPEALVRIEGTITIPGASTRRARVKRSLNGVTYALHIEYVADDGKAKKLSCLLSPPDELMSRRKAEGGKFKVILEEYARKAQGAFKMALPVGVREESEWL